MKNIYLSGLRVKLLFEEFNKSFDKSYKFLYKNGNQIKIVTTWTVLECTFYSNKKGNVVVMLSNNWYNDDINILINCITTAYNWEYVQKNPSCCMSNFCFTFFPFCYCKNKNTYNSKLVFEV